MTIGDFKLKSAADYVVPENERVNAEKKKAELFVLKEEVSVTRKQHVMSITCFFLICSVFTAKIDDD